MNLHPSFQPKKFLKIFLFSFILVGLAAALYLMFSPGGFELRKKAAEMPAIPYSGLEQEKIVEITKSQQIGQNIDDNKPALLTVIGEGNVKATPEKAQFSITYTALGKTSEEALSQEKNLREKIISLLASYGVSNSEITLYSPNITPLRQTESASYSVISSLSVEFQKLSELENLFAKLYTLGSLNISTTVFTTNNPRELEDRAIKKALYDAQLRAEKMAEAAGAKLGRVVSIAGEQTQNVATLSRKVESDKNNPGNIEIVRLVRVVYELK